MTKEKSTCFVNDLTARIKLRAVPHLVLTGRRSGRHGLLQVALDLVEEAGGGQPVLVRTDQ